MIGYESVKRAYLTRISARGLQLDILYFKIVFSFIDGPLKPDLCYFVLEVGGTYGWKCEERGECGIILC